MKRTYLGAVCGTEGSYGIVFRDLPGCTSAGDTLEDVRAMGAEALGVHLQTMIDYGHAIPQPTVHGLQEVIDWLCDPDDLDDNGPWVEITPIAVNIPDEEGTVVVRLKADLVQRIADLSAVNEQRINSGRFIELAVEHEIERYRKSAA
ncbi:type II toxin-antitoxin system HicB family antitoxin [Sphingomonas bacterium]|uniref:type II toxin-antitoxin system HicB family antitoxin n=1 Tax=Sphingomonas bacterium TaxID=1895847 RepID=UPI0015755706|nr:type II toxin-antitoxin system HicB family antitoxin [Sphingomonas bacterium]